MTHADDMAAISTALDQHEAAVIVDEAERDAWYRAAVAEIRGGLTNAKSAADMQALRNRVKSLGDGAELMHETDAVRDRAIDLDLWLKVGAAVDSWPVAAGRIPLHSQADLDRIKARGKDQHYTALANHRYGSLTYSVTLAYGNRLDLAEQKPLQFMASYVRAQADLYVIDGTPARKARIVQCLNALRTIVDVEKDAGAQYVLALGWSCVNLCYAAAVIGYSDPGFERFLRVCYPLLNRNGASNVQASCADSRLAIGMLLPDLWDNARRYFEWVVTGAIYLDHYEGSKVLRLWKVVPDGSKDPWLGTADTTLTIREWGNLVRPTDLTARGGPNDTPVPNGCTPEDDRDLSHANLLRIALRNGANTILAQGDTLKPHERDRVNASIDFQATRSLYYIDNQKFPYPVPVEGLGQDAWTAGWDGHARFCPTAAVKRMAGLYSTLAGELHIGPDELESAS